MQFTVIVNGGIIKQIQPGALLLNVTTPQSVRDLREEPGDKIKNIQRIKYWHSVYGDTFGCLLSQVDWSFNGAASLGINMANFAELVKFINSRTKSRGILQTRQQNTL